MSLSHFPTGVRTSDVCPLCASSLKVPHMHSGGTLPLEGEGGVSGKRAALAEEHQRYLTARKSLVPSADPRNEHIAPQFYSSQVPGWGLECFGHGRFEVMPCLGQWLVADTEGRNMNVSSRQSSTSVAHREPVLEGIPELSYTLLAVGSNHWWIHLPGTALPSLWNPFIPLAFTMSCVGEWVSQRNYTSCL